MSQKIFFDPSKAGDLTLQDWAKLTVYNMVKESKHMHRGAHALNRIIVDENGKSVFAATTWEKFLQQVRKGEYQPPQSKGISGRLPGFDFSS